MDFSDVDIRATAVSTQAVHFSRTQGTPVSDDIDLRKIVADVAAAYFSNSHVTPAEIPTVINQIATSLLAVGAPAPEMPSEAPAEPKLTPAQIRKSITREALISFEDNKPYKTLRRHLAANGLT